VSKAYVLPGSTDITTVAPGFFATVQAQGGLVVDTSLSSPAAGNPKDSALRASTAGGDWVVLEGSNFGLYDPNYPLLTCAYMAWWNRDPAAVMTTALLRSLDPSRRFLT
jgi:hypothetical protein